MVPITTGWIFVSYWTSIVRKHIFNRGLNQGQNVVLGLLDKADVPASYEYIFYNYCLLKNSPGVPDMAQVPFMKTGYVVLLLQIHLLWITRHVGQRNGLHRGSNLMVRWNYNAIVKPLSHSYNPILFWTILAGLRQKRLVYVWQRWSWKLSST